MSSRVLPWFGPVPKVAPGQSRQRTLPAFRAARRAGWGRVGISFRRTAPTPIAAMFTGAHLHPRRPARSSTPIRPPPVERGASARKPGSPNDRPRTDLGPAPAGCPDRPASRSGSDARLPPPAPAGATSWASDVADAVRIRRRSAWASASAAATAPASMGHGAHIREASRPAPQAAPRPPRSPCPSRRAGGGRRGLPSRSAPPRPEDRCAGGSGRARPPPRRRGRERPRRQTA